MAQILLADANPTNRRVVEISFNDEGIDVVSFADGKQAAEYLRENEVAVVLADISLPGLDGYRLCREVKRSPRRESLPVVLLSGRFQQFDAQRAEEVGYHCHVSKPVEPANLVELVRGLLQKEQGGGRRDGNRSPAVTIHPQESAMLFEIPVDAERQKVVFSLKPYQCKPSPGLLRREAPAGEPAAERPPAEPQAQPAPQPVPEHPEVSEAAQEPSRPEAAPAEERQAGERPAQDDVDRVVSKLADQLPDIVRSILEQEEKRD